ncbi:MAG: winged helix-turn-helix transcriptional regulator [Planctomycetes bacterium]|nr:winged helix-turn-helix transcriptional regulator [Planctomycetota bacterium]
MIATRESLRVRAKLFRGLADLSRMSILEILRDGPRNASEVVAQTGLTQPNVSMHLNCLWCCGLVEREVRGRFTYYSIKAKRKVTRLLRAAEDLLEDVYDRIVECSRYEDRSEKP